MRRDKVPVMEKLRLKFLWESVVHVGTRKIRIRCHVAQHASITTRVNKKTVGTSDDRNRVMAQASTQVVNRQPVLVLPFLLPVISSDVFL
jgi:hypothetical protein